MLLAAYGRPIRGGPLLPVFPNCPLGPCLIPIFALGLFTGFFEVEL